MNLFRKLLKANESESQDDWITLRIQAQHRNLLSVGARLLAALNLESKLASYIQGSGRTDQTLLLEWRESRQNLDGLLRCYTDALQAYSEAVSQIRPIEDLPPENMRHRDGSMAVSGSF